MPTLGSWLQDTLFLLALVNLGFTVFVLVMLSIGNALIKRLSELPIPELDRWPTISLIAPGRNEERNIEAAVRSLVQLDYPELEITLVNDRSTDTTGEVLDRLAAEFPRLNVVHIKELPAGWLGKNHAMQVGADRSRGEWLLFTDADILFEPTALKRAIGYALNSQLDHLAATPDTRMPSWLLHAFTVTFAIYFSIFFRIWAVRDPKSKAHVGIGAFNLVKADVYRAVEGHQRIKMRPDDDLKLGKIIKLAGYRQDVVHGSGMVVVEWYHSLSALVRGLEKNAFAGTDYSVFLTVFSTLLSLLFNVWPYIAVFVVPSPTRWIYLTVCLTLWFLAWLIARSMKAPQTCALAFPLTVLLMVYIQWRTMLLNYWQNGIRWRDTHYSLAELRANKV
jgi:cellulose synthase/poly-beta-1,6-N-acetylglucosamine synthase-like glycosyltransferase